MYVNLQKWRESASILLVAKTTFCPQTTTNDFNYKLLTLQRSKNVGKMPGTYAFPGGIVEKADSSPDWLKHYEKFGFKLETIKSLIPAKKSPGILISKNENEIPKYISLRITAIRETFEECGILICRSSKIHYKECLSLWAQFIGGHELKNWQSRVHKDPEQFLELCSQLELYPDIWALKEWSNWTTPVSIPGKFNALFFLAAFQQIPPTFADNVETQQIQWETPNKYLEQNISEQIILPPPQFYEMSTLKNFFNISNLIEYANEHALHGVEQFFPYRINTDTGPYAILPGDDLYPNHMNLDDESTPYVKNISSSNVQHRLHQVSLNKQYLILKNYKPSYNHSLPMNNKL